MQFRVKQALEAIIWHKHNKFWHKNVISVPKHGLFYKNIPAFLWKQRQINVEMVNYSCVGHHQNIAISWTYTIQFVSNP